MAKTLHEAIEIVLSDQPGRMATTSTIAKEIKRRKLWTRPSDGQFPPADQIRLRAQRSTYAKLFKLTDGENVRLLKWKPDQSQIALAIVEKAIGGKLANRPAR
jgi:hypothetical protein